MTGGTNRLRARGIPAALAICAALALTGLVLVAVSSSPGLDAPFVFPALLLVPLYLAAERMTIDFEFRRHSHSVLLTQIPLVLGALLVAPAVHLGYRLLAAVLFAVWQRSAPMKAAYNAGVACFDVGVVALAVSLAPADAHPGPPLWAALYAGLLIAELVTNAALHPVWWLLGIPVSWSGLRQRLVAAVLVSTVFTGLAIIAVLALWTDPFSAGLIAALAALLGLAYRTHRRLSAQQQQTERLYEFVKDLGPLDPDGPATTAVLQQVRELLHARHLDLALVGADGTWQHVAVSDGGADVDSADQDLAVRVASSGRPVLQARHVGDPDRMATPLVGSSGLLGVLTASERLGEVRAFDMGDLRLLETVSTELTTALERGRLLRDLGLAATTDTLTGLPNMAETTRRIDAQLGRGDVLVAAVAVESFREVNDTLGHQAGDALLLEVARRLVATSPDAVVGRIGGGRFAVSVPSADAGHDPEMLGLDLRHRIEGTSQVGPVGTHIRLSVGVVRAPEHGTQAATLLRRAETAMSSARDVHGGPVVWEPAYEVKGQRRLAVVTALREALVTGAIGVAYQPKVDAATGATTGVEALARWTHPALGPIGPDEFVPLAEASGLMGSLTSTVLRQALTACSGWQRRARDVGVSVNVSADTVLDPDFVTEVADLLAATNLDSGLLTLELTEGVVVADPALATIRLGELRGLGCKVSVDDFGTGYSSLTYLKGLPVDEVKIDKGFVDRITIDPADRAVVRGVVDIAHTLGLSVVAEGVEDQEQHDLLRELGVDEIQGYLHARPMPALDTAQWLRARESARTRSGRPL